MAGFRSKLLIILFFLFVGILAGGCATPGVKSPDKVGGIQTIKTGNESQSDFYETVLGVGDTIDIAVYRSKTSELIIGIGDSLDITVYRSPTSEFVLGRNDSIDIAVYRHSEFDRSVLLDSSGIIMFPLIGDIQATGKKTTELRDELKRKLSKYIVDPQVTIDVIARQALIVEDLSKSYAVSAQKNGKIMLPIIGEVQAAGKNVIEFRKQIQQKLSKYLVDPQVTIDVTPIESLEIGDLAISAKIGLTGKITLPLIGDVQVAGKGVFALRDEIEQRLSKYFVNPQVTINVTAVESQKVHILGEVISPGTLILDQKMLVWEGISRTGGFTTDANQNKVLLLRSENGVRKVVALDLNIKKMFKNNKLKQNVYLKNEDIIYVLPSIIANIERFMVRFSNIIRPFVTLEAGIVLYPQVADVLRGKEQEIPIAITP